MVVESRLLKSRVDGRGGGLWTDILIQGGVVMRGRNDLSVFTTVGPVGKGVNAEGGGALHTCVEIMENQGKGAERRECQVLGSLR